MLFSNRLILIVLNNNSGILFMIRLCSGQSVIINGKCSYSGHIPGQYYYYNIIIIIFYIPVLLKNMDGVLLYSLKL